MLCISQRHVECPSTWRLCSSSYTHLTYWGRMTNKCVNKLSDVEILDETKITKSCHCKKCVVESMFIKFSYMKRLYVVGGIYRHPNGNIKHFLSDLENALSSIVLNCTVIIAGDINIDLIKFNLDDNILYVTTLMSHGYLPYITLPTRITDFSTTCIDHIFVKDVTKESRTGKKNMMKSYQECFIVTYRITSLAFYLCYVKETLIIIDLS